jgi:hypothetical protein
VKIPKKRITHEATPAERIAAFGEEKVFELIMDGEFYEDIAKLCNVSRCALMNWLNKHEDLYAGARLARGHAIAEGLRSLAQDRSRDTDKDAVGRDRLIVDTDKWVVSKMLPSIYGDRTTLAGDPKAPLQVRAVVDLSGLSEEELVLLEQLTSKINGSSI